jgi:DNA mismatch repair protein MutS
MDHSIFHVSLPLLTRTVTEALSHFKQKEAARYFMDALILRVISRWLWVGSNVEALRKCASWAHHEGELTVCPPGTFAEAQILSATDVRKHIQLYIRGRVSYFNAMPYFLDPNSPEASTPVMKQFLNLKSKDGDSILFFRMGDFYELFGQDAITAAPILGITLTSRDRKSENPVPMAGVPYHSATNYIQKLLNAGKKVALAEQILPEGMTTDQIKGIVDRQIVRTFTPAVQFEMSGNGDQNFLATITPHDSKTWVLGLLDPATGIVKISQALTEVDLLAESSLYQIRHFLNSSTKTPSEILKTLQALPHTLVEEIPHNWVSDAEMLPFLQKQYQKMALDPLLESKAAQKCIALLIQYTLKTQALALLPHLHEPRALHESDRLITGPHTHTHLDSIDLFELINKTATSMGARALKQLLDSPFKQVAAIELQQESVQELAAQNLEASQIHSNLKAVYDLDRILGRVSTKLAHPRDTHALGNSLLSIFQFEEKLARFEAKKLRTLSSQLRVAKNDLCSLAEKIMRTQKPDAPIHTRDGGIFEVGTDPELDRLLRLTEAGEKIIVDIEMREREATGINSLKVKYNRVFGYFIEISSANLKNVPAHYQRKQTMVGGERFFTEELKKFEEEILSAASKQKSLESSLFQSLIEELIQHAPALKLLSEVVGELDQLIALSFLAQKGAWTFPKIDESFEFKLLASRHPVVDEVLKGQFVANDIELSPNAARTLIITGPNMGGKSTVMRQMAQIILLGQIGAPVPASFAHWGIFHSLYTRIGAQDAIAKGQSTFMVEMVELAHILNHADSRSFIVLDEIGRGTATYDGMSVASASLEYLHLRSQARIVFATHYHEMTELEARLPALRNAHMKVLDEKGKLTFLYEIALGRSSKSFGIQVAELAGLPKPVIKQAWSILKNLEAQAASTQTSASSGQLSLFSAPAQDEQTADAQAALAEALQLDTFLERDDRFTHERANELLAGVTPGLVIDVTKQLQDLDLNALRPIDALNLLAEIQQKLKTSEI